MGYWRERVARLLAATALVLSATIATTDRAAADAIVQTKGDWQDKFRQLDVDLPTPNTYRTASGAPGHQYWQQRADYRIEVKLDAAAKRLTGKQSVQYHNNSPDTLRYLWLQLDQNIYKDKSIAEMTRTASPAKDGGDQVSYGTLARVQALKDIKYGMEIASVTDDGGRKLPFTVVDTMMRIDLPRPLAPGASVGFKVEWAYNIINQDIVGGRSGYEHFRDNNTDLFFIAQWFPRMAAYTDYAGWQHKAFLGRGEFTLEFGDYDVAITVPADHLVSASGELQNGGDVLTATQRDRLAKAAKADKPMFIVTPDEALANEKDTDKATKTWRFTAKNVRDFAFASSNKFIWDAMGVTQDNPAGNPVLAMSFYPNEAEPLWSKYSTWAVAHTIKTYSKYSFAYPYPTAQSVNTWDGGGMEYPMITFNGYRPNVDKKTGKRTYTANAKYGLIGVVIHEVGHFYYPMIVNSDERQWSWMDEGLNTFVQNIAHLEWEENFGEHRRNPNLPAEITSYMTSQGQVPIMTQSDSVLQFGPNAYTKPATALTILRETVMGRELFDHAFREYSQRWKFKRPTPSDFFRSMEDASGIDLDWFWRGWFYTTDHVDIDLSGVREYRISTGNPDIEKAFQREEYRRDNAEPLAQVHNREQGLKTLLEQEPDLKDFYNENDKFTPTNKDRNKFADMVEGLDPWEREALARAEKDGDWVYFVDFANKGGLVMPLPLRLTYADGTTEFVMIPAEIWRYNSKAVTRMLIRPRQVVGIELDPRQEIADANVANNAYPRKIASSRLELYKMKDEDKDLMADMLVELKAKKDADGKAEPGKEVPLAPAGGQQ